MPRFDGTGPEGKGPFTGRGRGKCLGSISGPVGKTLASLAIPVLGVVINDIRKPDGITRKLLASVRSRISGKLLKNPDVGYISEKKERDKTA